MAQLFELVGKDLPAPGGRALVRTGQRCIAVFHTEGQLYAIDDSCPHQGASLAGGALSGRLVQCRAHGLRFDLASGCMPGVPDLRVATYPIQIEGGRVFLHLPDPESC